MTFRILYDIVATPFASRILRQEAPQHFLMPKFNIYYGRRGPSDQLMHFRHVTTVESGNDALLCKAFSSGQQRLT